MNLQMPSTSILTLGPRLLNEEGSLLATTGDDEKQVVVAAIVSNVYSQFQRLREKNLDWLMFECKVLEELAVEVNTFMNPIRRGG